MSEGIDPESESVGCFIVIFVVLVLVAAAFALGVYAGKHW